MRVATQRDLIAVGFADIERAERFLKARELESVSREDLLESLSYCADPDSALLLLVRIAEREPNVLKLIAQGDRSIPLFRVLGASEALGEFLVRQPRYLSIVDTDPQATFRAREASELTRELLESVGADPDAERPVATIVGTEGIVALRVKYRALLLDLAMRDLCCADPEVAFPLVAAELADLAGAAISAGLALARAEVITKTSPEAVDALRLAVIGMGKCGARELNYISDVDVIYVYAVRDGLKDDGAAHLDADAAAKMAAQLATLTARAMNASAPEPGLWELDANLRPEGKDGALSRTLDSHVAYYKRWAETWEFQALLKARYLAGDAELGAAYEEAVAPMIWVSSERDGFVESTQAMRRRVTDNIPAAEVNRQIKLGPGGLRDVEFTVQLLQLVHGRTEESLRVRNTLTAIDELAEAGYMSRADAANFGGAYRYLRVLEHRIQLTRLRRTHLMPTKPDAMRTIARASQGLGVPGWISTDEMLTRWQATKREVRGLHEKIFYRPLLATAANLSADEIRLTPEAAQARLKALGYADPKGAMRHIESLTSGVSRRSALQRQLLPILLGWIAEGVDPDAGLLGFRRLSEALGDSHWFLGMLRDSPAGAQRLCTILSSSRFITDLLEVSPESAAWLGNDADLEPQPFDKLWSEISSKLGRHKDHEKRLRLIRLIRRRELLRIALADSARLIDQDEVGKALSDVDRAAVLGILRVAEQEEYSQSEKITELLIVAMGRQGGREIGYGSDVDVMYVHRPLPDVDEQEAQQQALRIVGNVQHYVNIPLKPAILAEPKLEVDADLRPEGRQGPLVRTLDAYREYYSRWSGVWETQALLRARPLGGSDKVANEFFELVDSVRYASAITPSDVVEIRRIKARVEAERMPRGADPSRQLKLGRGGLSDVEWLVQSLQLIHTKTYPSLRTTSTRAALKALKDAELLPAADVEVLDHAWVLATRIRCANIIVSGRASDQLPRNIRDMEAAARWCGYASGNAAKLEDDYLKSARRARVVFEKHFYADE
ncbi:bifunctional [glutamine synthetase] adenylyltransferase/[glutamine synthetase]-adenylyl-L-tyrosine phosphorylase [Neomicrococcus lactis]|uniref:bifunctional [glutamine synthetase] adenylyltransferase/[glutamine synthetase]-adenylyl-L-tyrosine phosphorylase n=1 Tax=Neomicrococcus lactis TaxID=732241 RepID=UPI002301DACB|nr:bifunctional [glutamine synthetase] adenylyltransferase/[glutamine synthetase]-adenylyl-L-tyrosine phosphorylase [Neomicrococcus lactis]